MNNTTNTAEPTSQADIESEIERRKQLFAQAEPAEKRVLVAKDVIEQIKAEKFEAVKGNWVCLRPKNFDQYVTDADKAAYSPSILKRVAGQRYANEAGDDSLQKTLLGNDVESCACCALGGMFLSTVLYNNNAPRRSAGTDLGDKIQLHQAIPGGLTELFSREQLIMIEIAFECGQGYFQSYQEPAVYIACAQFGLRHGTNRSRLVAIMQNIIDNGGYFAP